MKALKITGIVSLIVFLLASVGIISWFTWIKLAGDKVLISDTYYVGLQTTTDGNTKHFVEVNYYKNSSGDGLGLYDVKFNYLMDENQTDFFSQGLQYVDNKKVGLEVDVVRRLEEFDENFWGWEWNKYAYVTQTFKSLTTRRYNYMSSDDYVSTSISTNPLDNNSLFKIQIGDELYGMKFKGEVEQHGYVEFDDGAWNTSYYRTVTNYDVDFFASKVFEGIQTLKSGTSHTVVFEFGDLFDYYEFDEEENQFKKDKVILDKAKLIEHEIKSYYSVLVNIHDSGVKRANESLFNCVDGSPSFNMTDVVSEDYFYGRTLISVDNAEGEAELTYVKVADNKAAIKLSNAFNNAYLPYAEKIELNILINLDLIIADGLEFVGFTADSGLSNYVVKNCQTVETIDGELVYSEVAYD